MVPSYVQGTCVCSYVQNKTGVVLRKRETTNMGSARLSGAFFALSNDGSQAMVGVGKPLSHDHLRTASAFLEANFTRVNSHPRTPPPTGECGTVSPPHVACASGGTAFARLCVWPMMC